MRTVVPQPKRRNKLAIQLHCCAREIRAVTAVELMLRVERHERNCPAIIAARRARARNAATTEVIADAH